MSLSSTPTNLINKYGDTTIINGSSVGKALWKQANLNRVQQFVSESSWGQVCYDVWVLPSYSPVNGQTIARSGQSMTLKAVAPQYAAGTLAYWLCLAVPVEGE